MNVSRNASLIICGRPIGAMIIAAVLAVATATVAQPTTPSPSDPPDASDTHYKGGGDNVPCCCPGRDVYLSKPRITDAFISHGDVHFRFSASGPLMRYNIVWSRQGQEVSDLRWTKPTSGCGNDAQDYVINEKTLPDTDYYFRVQSVGKTKIRMANGIYDYPSTDYVGQTFRTPMPEYKLYHPFDRSRRSLSPIIEKNPFAGKVDQRNPPMPHH